MSTPSIRSLGSDCLVCIDGAHTLWKVRVRGGTTLLLSSFWVVLGNLWESATGGVLMLPTQPGADCISQGSNVQPLKPHSALLPCTDCRERRGGVGEGDNQLAFGHTWRGGHTRGQVSLSQMLFMRVGCTLQYTSWGAR